MKLTICTMADELFVFDVSDDLELENFKVLCEFETLIPARELLLIFNGRQLLDNAASLSSYGIQDGDILVVQYLQGISGQMACGGQAPSAGGRPAAEKFDEVFTRQQQERADRDREFSDDPFDIEEQQLVDEAMWFKNDEHNMETAMEEVSLLYIAVSLNGRAVTALIDPASESSSMSQDCAERCGIVRCMDTTVTGKTVGVRTRNVVGRVHAYKIQIGPVFLSCSFSILEGQPMDMLLGLDMLKRHQFIIDLKNHKYIIGPDEISTSIVSEAELQESSRLSTDQYEPLVIEYDNAKEPKAHLWKMETVKQFIVPNDVQHMTTMNDKFYLASTPVNENPCIKVYQMESLTELAKIDLAGINVESLSAGSDVIYILQKTNVFRSVGQLGWERNEYKMTTFALGIGWLKESVVRLSTSGNGHVLVLVSNKLPDLSTLTVYDKMGYMQRQVSLSPSRLLYTGIFAAHFNSKGNLVIAGFNIKNDGLAAITEFHGSRTAVRQHASSLYGDCDMVLVHDFIFLVGDNNEFEVTDSDFNILYTAPKPLDPLPTVHIPLGIHHNRKNDTIVRMHKVLNGKNFKYITISHFTKV